MGDSTDSRYDLVIVGGGPAGMSAALWADDLGMSSLIIERGAELGGQLLRTFNPISNYLGRHASNGRELRDVFAAHLGERTRIGRVAAEISEIDCRALKARTSAGEIIEGRSMLIATGVRRRRLGIPGEAEFAGRGIIESGKQAEDSVGGQHVAIIGGGDAALENALILAEKGARVTLIHRRNVFTARSEFESAVRANPEIEILTGAQALAIRGDKRVSNIEVSSEGDHRSINVDLVLIRIGVEPETDLVRGILQTDRNGYISVDHECRTNIPGIYAAGDCANPASPTIATAAGMGATAAKSIYSWLNR